MKFVLSQILIFTLLMADFAEISSDENVNFEKLARAYADKIAKKCRTTVSQFNLYGSKSLKTEKCGIDFKFENMRYSKKVKKISRPSKFYSQEFTNGQTEKIQSEFIKKVELKESYTWKVTAKVSLQTSLEVKVSVPLVADATGKVSTTFEMSGEYGKTVDKTETVEQKHLLTIPPKSIVKATLVVTEQEMDIPWRADIVITGSFFFTINDFLCGRLPSSPLFINWYYCEDVKVLANNQFKWDKKRGLIYKTKGIFKSVRGTVTTLETEQYDYNPKNMSQIRKRKRKPKKKTTIKL